MEMMATPTKFLETWTNRELTDADLREKRSLELKNKLVAWANIPGKDRSFVVSHNALLFRERPYYVMILDRDHPTEICRGRSREDACAQALQVLAARGDVT